MEGIPVKEAAARWGVSQRSVQRLLKEGRIRGAKKFGGSWIVPVGAEKPAELRKKRRSARRVPSPYLPCTLLTSSIPLPPNEEEFLLSLDDDLRAQYANELAYLRGDCGPAKDHFWSVAPGERTFLCSCAITLSAAISSGDYALYSEAASSLRRVARGMDSDAGLTAEAALVTSTISMFDRTHLPFWLQEGDLLAFPPEGRPWAMYLHAKYLQNLRQFQPMLDVARTALHLCSRPEGVTLLDIYLRLMCAAACCGLKDWEGTGRWLSEALAAALPQGFVMPFAETILTYGGVLESRLLTDWPQHHEQITEMAEGVWKNWLAFHNRFTRDNISLVLTTQEQILAQHIAEGVSCAGAALRMRLSLNRTRKLLTSVYSKLRIRNWRDLRHIISPLQPSEDASS